MEGIQETGKKPLDKYVETAETDESNEASKLSNEVRHTENSKVFVSVESTNNDSENMSVSPRYSEKENALSSEEITFVSSVQQEALEKVEDSNFETSLSAEMDANVEGIPIGGGDLSENECVPGDELDSEKNCLDNSVSEPIKVLSGNETTGDFHVNENPAQKEKELENNTLDVDNVASDVVEASEMHSVDNVETEVSDVQSVDNVETEASDVHSVDNVEAEESDVHSIDNVEAEASDVHSVDNVEGEASDVHSVDNAEAEASDVHSVDNAEAEASDVHSIDNVEAEASDVHSIDNVEAEESDVHSVDNVEGEASDVHSIDNVEAEASDVHSIDNVEAEASDLHSDDNVDPLASDVTLDNPNEFQKESSADGYRLDDSDHNFPKSVVSETEIPECSESESEAIAAQTVMDTDDVSAPASMDCERTVIQNDLKNHNEVDDDEKNHENKEMHTEESVISENTASMSGFTSESKIEVTNDSKACIEGGSNVDIEDESVIESKNNEETEINEECNETECVNSERKSTVVVSPVSRSGVEEIEADENSLTKDNENSIKNVTVTNVISEASDFTNMETDECEQPEEDPTSDTNKEDEEMLCEEDNLQVQKDDEKKSHSDSNNQEEEMSSEENEVDNQRSSEMESHRNVDDEILIDEEIRIDVQKSFGKECEEISVHETTEENVGGSDKGHPEVENEGDENHTTRQESAEVVNEEGTEEKSEKSDEKVSEKTSVSKEVDSDENSRDMQENVEFVQIDSDKDENSQQSVDITEDEPSVIEKDPIALTNEESKEDDDVIIEEETNNQQVMEVDCTSEVRKDEGSIVEKTAESEEPESVDISEMCETVLEETNSTIFKNTASGASQKHKKKRLVTTTVEAEVIDIDEIEDSEMDKSQPETSKNKGVEDGKGKRKANVVSNQISSGNDVSSLDDEEICIIPDTVPKIITGKEAKAKTEALRAKRISKSFEGTEKNLEKSPEPQKDAPESRRTPGRPQRQAAKRAESQIKEIAAIDEAIQETEEPRTGGYRVCDSCFKVRIWVTSCKVQDNGIEKNKYFCSQECASNFKKISRTKSTEGNVNSTGIDQVKRFTRKCAQCSLIISGDEKNLSWETMDYCNEECLGRYQKVLGSQCANCKGTVASASLGKYCVRFGYDVKQFCCSGCLEEFKKGLKNCSYCQKDISSGAEGFLAPVGDKGQFKDFCTQLCMEKYDQMSNNHAPPVMVQVCAVCNNEKVVSMEVIHKNRINKFCSEPCFAAFRFVNGMMADQCYMCKKYFDKKEVENFSVYSDDSVHSFCSKTCMNVYILGNRKIVACHWCKVKKYNFDMIKRVFNSGQLLLVCSLNCLQLYQSGVNTASAKRQKCDLCGTMNPPQYNLNMSDNTMRSFCSYPCVMKFQEKFSNSVIVDPTPYPTGGPKRYVGPRRSLPVQQNEAQSENVPNSKNSAAMPVISSVQSLASEDDPAQNNTTTRSSSALKQVNNNIPQNQSPKVVRQVIIRPPVPKQMRNKAVTCRVTKHTKGTHCRPIICSKETQTESAPVGKPVLIPIPVPIYVPTPMCMYSTSFPVPVPFPLPVPVPVFIPTTRNSAKGIMKEIKRIQEKIPSDPFEAEILMMAEIVANQKKEENCDSDSDVVDNADAASAADADADVDADADEETRATTGADGSYTPENVNVDSSNTFGDDMLQMALLKMATELEEPTDLEAALTPTTITTQPSASVEHTNSESEDDPEPVQSAPEPQPQRGKKRPVRSVRYTSSAANKRRRISASGEPPHLPPPEPPQSAPIVEIEKPDANMCLKYTLGVNAWKRWVLTKNAELEKAAASNRKLKLFKTEILQQTADELNYSLCLFVKEVRKPNGQEYAPDTIYYLCLGIQQYLFESGRIDNIFTDPYYEKFTECLDEVAKKFSSLYNDSQFIVTRVEEEHLWESKQLGAHSPHVLLSTLMFFNTKHFNLTTVEEHMQLSFSHIMKHWKRNPNQSGGGKGGSSSSRNVLLRFYPPQSALEANSKKKKVYEQQENEENPLRCPVKLYEFYLSKCPESVKTRNDVFYLLPERSCVPDSPVWYSTMALGKEPLMKMLHRVKMVKEINQALLKS